VEETAEAVRRCQSSSEGGAEKKSVRLEARSVSAGKRVLFLRVGRTSAEVTVRISIHSHVLVTEPFLVVGLIASIRRILVITLEAATLTKGGTWSTEAASILFRASMIGEQFDSLHLYFHAIRDKHFSGETAKRHSWPE
jgi:hypothetical protein